MPSIQGTHDGRAAIVNVAILDAAKYREHKQSAARLFQGAKPLKALIDTGATTTMIAPRVVSMLGLQQTNIIEFAHLSGVTLQPGYLFHVAFFPPSTPTEVSTLQVFRQVINGGGLRDNQTFDVLLGMDVISSGDLRVDRTGAFRFSF